jgi:adenylosuccinate lyase
MNPFDKGNRYEKTGEKINQYFSEEKYYQEATLLELHYLKHITNVRLVKDKIVKKEKRPIIDTVINQAIYGVSDIRYFSIHVYPRIIELEKEYNHDIVAVQYAVMEIMEEFDNMCDIQLKNYVHWGLTSQDIVNTVYTKLFHNCVNKHIEKSFGDMMDSFMRFSSCDISIIGKTHGQNALPMHVSHIYKVYSSRLLVVFETIDEIKPFVKFGNGAIGNQFSRNGLGSYDFSFINRSTLRDFMNTDGRVDSMLDECTFQNNNYPYIVDVLYQLHKMCNILKDLSMDMWLYSSMGYISKKFSEKEHGSSTMPQKSNPIEFENAEGNLELAIGMIDTFTRKLNLSRLQRDLSDITMMRNIGMVLCYIDKSLESLEKGFSKFGWCVDGDKIKNDLNDLSSYKEFIQLREKLVPNGLDYETIKSMDEDDVKIYVEKHFKN